MRLPLLHVRDGQPKMWRPTTIRELGRNEAYLEALIGKSPELLGLEGVRTHVQGPYAAFHQLGVDTPSGQTVEPDIVFLTMSGHVIVVEVKVAGNEELRGRKVISQVIEYAASIATYSEEQLVELFDSDAPDGARFSAVVRKHFPDCSNAVELADELVRKIQAAEIHLVIACDQAPEGLRDFVAAVTAQQALGDYELRVCELVPYVGADGEAGGLFVVPSHAVETRIVGRTSVEVVQGAGAKPLYLAKVTPEDELRTNLRNAGDRAPRVPHPQIEAALEAYRKVAEPGTFEGGRAANYRFIFVEGWPTNVHYEFIHLVGGKTLGVELHFEDEEVRAASNAIRDAGLKPGADLPGLSWDQSWTKGKGRLRVLLPEDVDPAVAARTMVALIRKTRSVVTKALAG